MFNWFSTFQLGPHILSAVNCFCCCDKFTFRPFAHLPKTKIPEKKLWAWKRDGHLKRDGSQMCTSWKFPKQLRHNCLLLIMLCMVSVNELIFFSVQDYSFSITPVLSHKNKKKSFCVGVQHGRSHQKANVLPDVFTCGSAGSPADSTLCLQDSGEGQEHSALSASSGNLDLCGK